MRIGIDARALLPRLDGIGRYTRCLIAGLLEFHPENEYVLFALPETNLEFARGENVRIVRIPHRHLSLFTVTRFGGVVHRERLDLLHVPFFVKPARTGCPVIVTVHDLMALTFPRFFSGRSRVGEAAALLYHRLFVPRSVRTADRIFADSEYTRGEIMEKLRFPPERIEVIYPILEPDLAERPPEESIRECMGEAGLTGPFLLYAGNTKPYKNIPGLLRGFARCLAILPEDSQPVLALLGNRDRFHEEVGALADELGIAAHVRFLGSLEDKKMKALMAGATAFCFPSLSEGFGLPVLEAMALETPVITSKTASLPEVAGDAALLIDPSSPDEIGQAMAQVLTDEELRKGLATKGPQRARVFDRRQTVERVVRGYENVR